MGSAAKPLTIVDDESVQSEPAEQETMPATSGDQAAETNPSQADSSKKNQQSHLDAEPAESKTNAVRLVGQQLQQVNNWVAVSALKQKNRPMSFALLAAYAVLAWIVIDFVVKSVTGSTFLDVVTLGLHAGTAIWLLLAARDAQQGPTRVPLMMLTCFFLVRILTLSGLFFIAPDRHDFPWIEMTVLLVLTVANWVGWSRLDKSQPVL